MLLGFKLDDNGNPIWPQIDKSPNSFDWPEIYELWTKKAP